MEIDNILKPMQNIRKKLETILSGHSKDIKKDLLLSILGAFSECERYAHGAALRAITAEAVLKGEKVNQVRIEDQLEGVKDYIRNVTQEASSYADKAKSRNRGETLIVKPKENKNVDGKQIKSEFKTNIDPAELEIGIADVKTMKNGLRITCESKEDTEKLQREVESKMGSKYDIKQIQKTKPKLKIIGIDEELTGEELIRKIRHQNSDLKVANLEIIVIKRMKKKYMAIMQVEGSDYNTIMKAGKLKIGWSVCPVYEHVGVLRCFKCFGYNHKSAECSRERCCARCGGRDHQTTECKSEDLKCVNCEAMNSKLGLKLDSSHTVYDIKCPVYLRNVERRKEKIEYQK